MSLAAGRLCSIHKEAVTCSANRSSPGTPTTPAQPGHSADLAVFVITTTLCALGALMLPLAG